MFHVTLSYWGLHVHITPYTYTTLSGTKGVHFMFHAIFHLILHYFLGCVLSLYHSDKALGEQGEPRLRFITITEGLGADFWF